MRFIVMCLPLLAACGGPQAQPEMANPCDDLAAALEENAGEVQRAVLGARRDPI